MMQYCMCVAIEEAVHRLCFAKRFTEATDCGAMTNFDQPSWSKQGYVMRVDQ